ncbi:MAG: T9SS type A sorting domain-containing protein [Chitinophagales bacterium]|nr:T9SS type A sorting domain-containing protein [Chitinophagales bacterium]
MMKYLFTLFLFAASLIPAGAQAISWITDCTDRQLCTNQGSCSQGTIQLVAQAQTNFCPNQNINYLYRIDLGNDGSIDVQMSNDTAIGTFAAGTHKISWRASDGCGNIANCTYLFTIRDCQPPSLVCVNGLTQSLDPPICEETFLATQFVLSASDNCTPQAQLQFGIRATGTGTGFPTETSITYDECDIGLRLVEVWVRDQNGLVNSCSNYVLVQEGSGGCNCNPDGDITLTGCVKTVNNKKLSQYSLEMQTRSTAGLSPAISKLTKKNSTDSCFNIKVSQLPFGADYGITLRAARDVDAINGLSTLDLLLISKHILGIEPFTNLYQALAADVNLSNSVTTLDIVEIRKVILGIRDTFPVAPSWRLMRPLNTPGNMNQPLSIAIDSFAVSVSALADDPTFSGFNFIALKMGDINNNSTPFSGDSEDRSNLPPLSLQIPSAQATAGQELTVPFYLKESIRLDGWQMALRFDPDQIEVLGIEGLSPEDYTMSPSGIIRALWIAPSGLEFDHNKALMHVRVRMRAAGNPAAAIFIDDNALRAEAYSAAWAGKSRAISWQVTPENGAFSASVQPNPFSDNSNLQVNIPQSGNVNLEMLDVQGRLIWSETRYMEIGTENWVLPGALFPSKGLYIFRLRHVRGDVLTGKLMKH